MDYLRLDEICNLNMGQSPSSDSYNQERIGIPFFQGNADFGELYPNIRVWCDKPTKVVDKGTLLISVRAPIGALNFASEKSCIGRGLAGLTAKNGYDLKYIYYALKYKRQELESKGTGSTFKAISRSSLGEVLICNIPIMNQKEYVKKLDLIQKIIIDERKQIEQLDVLIKSRFVEMFGDPILNDRQFETITGKDFFKLTNGKAVLEEKRKANGIPAYGGNGISWYTDEMLCEEDTLVVGRVGFQSGNVHLAKGPLWVTDNAMYISEFYVGDCDLVFLCALMEHINFTRYQDAGDLKKITQKPFMQMEFIFPPVNIQKQYSAFVHQVDKLKVEAQGSLKKAQLLFDSLMQQYFG